MSVPPMGVLYGEGESGGVQGKPAALLRWDLCHQSVSLLDGSMDSSNRRNVNSASVLSSRQGSV